MGEPLTLELIERLTRTRRHDWDDDALPAFTAAMHELASLDAARAAAPSVEPYDYGTEHRGQHPDCILCHPPASPEPTPGLREAAPTTTAGKEWWRKLGGLPDDAVYIFTIEEEIRAAFAASPTPEPLEAGLFAVRDDRLAVKAELHRIAPECDGFLNQAYAATPNRGIHAASPEPTPGLRPAWSVVEEAIQRALEADDASELDTLAVNLARGELDAALAASPAPEHTHFEADCEECVYLARPTVIHVPAEAASPAGEGLDAAWAEVEALTKDGGWLVEFGRRDTIEPMLNPHTGYPVKFPGHYFAAAAREFSSNDEMTEYGDTPAAALRALAARLKEPTE